MSLPDKKAFASHYLDFVEDLETTLTSFIEAGHKDGELKAIFKSATAAYAVFDTFSADRNALLLACTGIARRCSMLSIVRQLSLARVELRRMIECVVWYVYFLDHPVEWADFTGNPGRAWGGHSDTPIAAAASAGVRTFFAYAKERLRKDTSGLGKAAVETLQNQYGHLSAEVHAAMGAVHPSGSLALAYDQYDRTRVARLHREMHRVFAASVQVCAAVNPLLIAKLDAVGRAWFDWLVAHSAAKTIRGGTFGIRR